MDQALEVAKVCLKFREWAAQRKLLSLGLAVADHNYYGYSLEKRKGILGAPSTDYLCKTIVLENKAFDQKFAGEFYPQYICVVFQYGNKFHSDKLAKYTKYYQNNNCVVKTSNKHYHWRLVEEQKSRELTGYDHNGVVPILTTTPLPVVVSHKIEALSPQFFWMGGGHPIVKLRISLDQFCQALGSPVLIGDVTEEDKPQ